MAAIAAIITAIASLIVAVAAVFLLVKLSNVADLLSEQIKKQNKS